MSAPEPFTLAGDRVLSPDGEIRPGWVRVHGDRIDDVGAGPPPSGWRSSATILTLNDRTLIPGLVDIHCHGGFGASFTTGDPAQARTAAAGHARAGTTTVMASLVTGTLQTLTAAIRDLTPVVRDDTLAGIHLEGPWLSPQHRGAHDPGLLRTPTTADLELLLAFQTPDGNPVRMVTIAPELPGALGVISALRDHGVVAAIGHTDADHDQAAAGFAAGATGATHLFNTMRPLHHREPGAVAACLDQAQFVELIADGVHLHPAVVSLLRHHRGVVLVTDAMAAAGMGDGTYELGPLPVRVRDGVARLADTLDADAGAIAGSTLTLARAVRFCVQQAGFDLGSAVLAASAAPARALGLDDVGVLAPGYLANLVILDDDLAVRRVYRRGRVIRDV